MAMASVTVTLFVACWSPAVAVTRTVPAETPVTTPLSIVAQSGLSAVHWTASPSATPDTVRVMDLPTATTSSPAMAMLDTTVIVWVVAASPTDAVMTAVELSCVPPVTLPVASTVRMASSLLDQVTPSVTSFPEASYSAS